MVSETWVPKPERMSAGSMASGSPPTEMVSVPPSLGVAVGSVGVPPPVQPASATARAPTVANAIALAHADLVKRCLLGVGGTAVLGRASVPMLGRASEGQEWCAYYDLPSFPSA